MDERTEMIPQPEVTAALQPVTCPVCGATSNALERWCGECGFRLDQAPGETLEAAPAWTLTDGVTVYRLKPGDNVVGRLNADVFLSDPSVSRRHAVVTVAPEGVTVRDEGSSNGTKVNGEAIPANAETPAVPGFRVEFGSVRLTLVGPDGQAPEPEIIEAVPAAETPAVARLSGEAGVFALRYGANTVGRRDGNAVTIPDPFVSGLHAVITIGEGTAVLTDSGSTNGTFLSEARLEPGVSADLQDGAVVRFGQVELRFEWLPEAETAPEVESEPEA